MKIRKMHSALALACAAAVLAAGETGLAGCGLSRRKSEYVRDLIRRDKERAEQAAFERLKAELAQAYAAPESAYQPLTAAEVIARNRRG